MSEQKPSYKASLNLPKTTLPMKANLARREPAQLAEWEEGKLYEAVLEVHADDPTYMLHDGPPYANGHIHIGHALNKILKDIIVKSQSMSGHRAPYVPGWDCHGLPIEHQVLKKLGSKKRDLSKLQIRQLCREYALKFVEIQKEEFKRLGIFGDWDQPYLTLTPDYEAQIIREFSKVYATGGVYQGKKPVLWCSFDETALAEAEVEHADYVSPSIYVKFKVRDDKGLFSDLCDDTPYIVIWTTTPWTLVANKAIALHPELSYCLVKTSAGTLLVAEELVTQCLDAFDLEVDSVETLAPRWLGKELEGVLCEHPWLDQDAPVVLGHHVTLEQGTGCVHTAPGHGQDDYEVGLKYDLAVYAPVDHRGRYTDAAGQFAGLKVKDANGPVIALLEEKGLLLSASEIHHAYPHCWRCKKPVIYRATEQWFISMSENDLRARALKSISEDVKWIPKWGQDRIEGMISNRPDWCISRQRVWGVPIVAFGCVSCRKVMTSEKIIAHVADLMAEGEGSDIWFSRSAQELMPEGLSCEGCGGIEFKTENDILDVWFESGVSHAAVLKARPALTWPADLYLEGSDQHRGWFHSTMLASLMTDNQVPYRSVLTHGFVVDGAGKKMSKSVGNVMAPQEIIGRHGADILRLWVAATDFREDIRISPDIIKQITEAYRKIRNTCRFLVGNLSGYSAEVAETVSKEDYLDIDLWALERLSVLNEKVQQAYRDSSFHIVFHSLNHFCTVELSSFYLDILKDRLYTDALNDRHRRAAQAVMQEILTTLLRLMAPILSFTAEEIWKHLPEAHRAQPSVHLSQFTVSTEVDPERQSRWQGLMDVREAVSRVLERARQARKIGNPLESALLLRAKRPLYEQLQAYRSFLPSLFIVSQVQLEEDASAGDLELVDNLAEPWSFKEALSALGLSIVIEVAQGEKCARCWVYNKEVGQDSTHDTLCRRCITVIQALPESDEH